MAALPKVTVSLITYNHAAYIAQAIEGVLAQRTSFPFELVIGEDESSDGTREIVQRYAAAHPAQIRLHLHRRADNIAWAGQPTGRRNLVHNLRDARGEYIALLDGDDYFTDPEKLRRQADFLDAHPECSTCFHRVRTVDEADQPVAAPPPAGLQPRFTLTDLLARRFQAPTASVMYRRGLFDDFPEWYFRCAMGDFPLHVLNGLKGDFGFLDREMAAYRVHAGGRWSAAWDHAGSPEERRLSRERKLRQFDGIVELYKILATAGLGAAYDRTLREAIAHYRFSPIWLLREAGDWPSVRGRLWETVRARSLPAEVSWRQAAWLFLESCAPGWLRQWKAQQNPS